jgi:type VI protein secretion system component Hcp
MRVFLSIAAALATLAAGGTTTAHAQVETFLLVSDVQGESMNVRHVGWIDLVSFGQTLEPNKRVGGLCEGYAIKRLDSASPALWAGATSGTVFAEMKVEMERGSPPVMFFEQQMLNVRVARVVFGEKEGVPTETITLLPQSVTMSYRVQRPDGTVGSRITSTVHCAP